MNSTPSADPGTDPAATAISLLLPQMKSAQTQGWLWALAWFVGLGGVAAWMFSLGEDGIQWGIFAAVFAAIIPFWVATSVRKKHEKMVLPVVAETFGLSHVKDPGDYFASLPSVFIPQGGRRSADDQMSGTLAGRWFRFTEVKTETGGKHSRVLFRGVVVEVENGRRLPDFVIASTKETKGFLFMKGNVHVEGMDYHEGLTGPDGTYYGLWSPPGTRLGQLKGLTAFMERMANIGPQVLGDSKLYSVACTGGSILLALRHDRDLFQIGGLLANEQSIMSDIRSAASELSHPIALVTEVLRAEEALAAASSA